MTFEEWFQAFNAGQDTGFALGIEAAAKLTTRRAGSPKMGEADDTVVVREIRLADADRIRALKLSEVLHGS